MYQISFRLLPFFSTSVLPSSTESKIHNPATYTQGHKLAVTQRPVVPKLKNIELPQPHIPYELFKVFVKRKNFLFFQERVSMNDHFSEFFGLFSFLSHTYFQYLSKELVAHNADIIKEG